MAFHISRVPITLAGFEEMGLTTGSPYMAHALGSRKPWRRGFLMDAIRRGVRPSFAARKYWDYVREPLPVFSSFQVLIAKLEIKASVIAARILG